MHQVPPLSPSSPSLALLAALFLTAGGPAQGQTVQFRQGTNPPPPLTIVPTNPTPANTLQYVALTDGNTYPNACAAGCFEGQPSISINPDTRTILVTFASPCPPSTICSAIFIPVNGIYGGLGQLSAGTWWFEVKASPSPQTNSFYVIGPPSLSFKALSGSTWQLSWPVMSNTFTLESSTDLLVGGWEPVTNPPVLMSHMNRVPIELGPGNRFFRLRGQ